MPVYRKVSPGGRTADSDPLDLRHENYGTQILRAKETWSQAVQGFDIFLMPVLKNWGSKKLRDLPGSHSWEFQSQE